MRKNAFADGALPQTSLSATEGAYSTPADLVDGFQEKESGRGEKGKRGRRLSLTQLGGRLLSSAEKMDAPDCTFKYPQTHLSVCCCWLLLCSNPRITPWCYGWSCSYVGCGCGLWSISPGHSAKLSLPAPVLHPWVIVPASVVDVHVCWYDGPAAVHLLYLVD